MSTYVFKITSIKAYNIIEVVNMYSPMLDPVKVGNVIAEFRKRKNLPQEVLSGLAGIGRSHLSAIERGERKPTLETFYKICNALDVKMSVVISEIEKEI